MSGSSTRSSRSRSSTPAERESFAEQRRGNLEELHGKLTTALGTLSGAQEWRAWLTFASGFHRYSMNNSLLIMLQTGGQATMVAGYRAWQGRGRQVRTGERAIRILAPSIKKVDLVDRNGEPVRDDQGKPRRGDKLIGMRVASVFDVSATDGDPLPERPEAKLLTGQAPAGLWDALADIVHDEGYMLSRGDCGGANGWTAFDTKEVRVRADVDDLQACKTLCHELGHLLAGHGERGTVDHRGVQEVVAESVAFMVLQAHQVDSSEYTFNYVVGWAEQAATADVPVEDVVRRTGERVIAVADRILARTQPDPTSSPDAVDALGVQVVAPAPERGVAERSAPVPVWESVGRRPAPPAAEKSLPNLAGTRGVRAPSVSR
jgi:N-terminal domain of anti-restriction factor ArdC